MKIEDINNPLFIKNLNYDELNILSAKLREYLLQHMSKHGGFLGPNLSVVEITLALHYVFNFPFDYLFFDIGMSSYVHKILTGRCDSLSNFSDYKESKYDSFGASFKGDTLGIALGLAYVNEKDGAKNEIIVVVDGASFNSASFIANLKEISLSDKKLIVILNDNRGLNHSSHLNHLYNAFKNNSQIDDLKESIVSSINKNNITKNIYGSLEEKMSKKGDVFSSIDKYGPIDGHNIKELIKCLSNAKKAKHSTIIHCITNKGNGYNRLENSLRNGLYTKAFNINSSKSLADKPHNHIYSYEVLANDLIDILNNHKDRFVLLNVDQYEYHLEAIKTKHPQNVIDLKNLDHQCIDIAIGLSLKHPIYLISSATSFNKYYNEYLNYIYKERLNIKLILLDCSINTNLPDRYQGIYCINNFANLNDLSIYEPSCTYEIKYALNTSFDKQAIIRIEDCYFKKEAEVKVKDWYYLLNNENYEATIISYGPHIKLIKEAIEINNLNYNLVNALDINNLDKEILDEIKEHNKPLIIYQLSQKDSSLAYKIKNYYFDSNYRKVRVMGLKKEIMNCRGLRNLIKQEGLTIEDIVKEVKDAQNN